MNNLALDRGVKRTCLSCEARFYDLARVPALCPKCGAEFVEVVRPAPSAYQRRKISPFGRGRSNQPFESGQSEGAAREDSRSEDEEREPGEEEEREIDGDGESEPETAGEGAEE